MARKIVMIDPNGNVKVFGQELDAYMAAKAGYVYADESDPVKIVPEAEVSALTPVNNTTDDDDDQVPTDAASLADIPDVLVSDKPRRTRKANT